MGSNVLVTLVVAALGGGLIAAVFNFISDVRRQRRDDKRLPYDTENLITQTAERAVASLSAALDERDRTIERLEARIAELEAERGQMIERITAMEDELHEQAERIASMLTELSALRELAGPSGA